MIKKSISVFILGCTLVNVSLSDNEGNLTGKGILCGTLPVVGNLVGAMASQGAKRRMVDIKSKGESTDVLKQDVRDFATAYAVGSSLYIPLYVTGATKAYKKKRKKLAAAIATVGVVDVGTRLAATLSLYTAERSFTKPEMVRGALNGALPVVGNLVGARAPEAFRQEKKGLYRGSPDLQSIKQNGCDFAKGYVAGSSLYIPLYAGGALVAYKKKRKKLAAAIATVGVVDVGTRLAATLYYNKVIA